MLLISVFRRHIIKGDAIGEGMHVILFCRMNILFLEHDKTLKTHANHGTKSKKGLT